VAAKLITTKELKDLGKLVSTLQTTIPRRHLCSGRISWSVLVLAIFFLACPMFLIMGRSLPIELACHASIGLHREKKNFTVLNGLPYHDPVDINGGTN